MKSWKLLGASLAVMAVVACESGEDKAVKFAENAQQYLDEGELDRARIQFTNALKNDPDNPVALRGAAEVAEQEERFGDQLRFLQRLSNVEPDDMVVLAKTARLNLLAGRPERAQRRARRVLEKDPTNIEALTVLGAAQVLENNLDGASETLELALEQDPNNTEVRNLLAARYVRDEDFEQAGQIIEEGLTADPSNEALLVVRLLLTQRRQDVDGMDQTLQRLIEVSPENGFYRERYAEFLIVGRNDLEGARSQLEEALPLLDDRTDAVGRLVGIVRAQDGDAAGEELLTSIVSNYPDDSTLVFAVPSYLCEIGENERCEAELDRLAALDNTEVSHQAKVQIGERLFTAEDFDGALAKAEEVLAVDDTEPNALTLKGKVQLAQESTRPAIETLRSALASEPDKESAQILLGLAYEADGRAPFGEAQLAQAIDRNGLSPELFQAYRGMLARNGKADEAADLTLRFAQTSDATPQVQRESAAVLLAQGRADEAEVVARGLIRTNGSDQVARRILATAQLQQSRPEDAIETIDGMADQARRELPSIQIKSQALSAMERAEDLRAYLTEALNRAEFPEVFALFNQFELSQGNLSEAETVVLQGLEAYPKSQGLYLSLYNTRIARGNEAEAIEALTTGIETADLTANLRILLSNEYLQEARRREAKEVLRSLQEDNLLNDLAANNLAALMLDLGEDEEEALEIAKRFEGTDQPFFADTLAWAYYRTGDLQSAKRYSDIADRADAANAEILYHRGVISAAVGDIEEAREAFSRALDAPGKTDIVNDEVIQQALNDL
ncbi:MAG: tetratricopeptide repeat protein [Parvularculaceae bacterium]|nr:tetratricopeptide repeat protein [Parvularculaceae bacterium]